MRPAEGRRWYTASEFSGEVEATRRENEGGELRRPRTDYALGNHMALRTLPVICTARCSSEPVPLVS